MLSNDEKQVCYPTKPTLIMKGKLLENSIKERLAKGMLWDALEPGLYHLPQSNLMVM